MSTVISVVSVTMRLYSLLILAKVILSWISFNPYRLGRYRWLVRVLDQLTEPIVAPLRRLIPPVGGTVDISPAVALILLEVLRILLVALLSRL